MSNDFLTKLSTVAAEHDSWLCVGLDPVAEKLPKCLPKTASGVVEFCTRIVAATSGHVCAYKPNIAFFEALGVEAFTVLRDVLDAIPEEIPVILDAKRGDIGNTAQLYAVAYYDRLGVDAVTVNPYMGWDAVRPFAEWPGKAAIVLCLTSNPSAREIQTLDVGGEPLFLRLARMVAGWPGSCGLVVGATQSDVIGRVRGVAPQNVFLIPGVGAQGGDLEASVRLGSWSEGGGAIINASRSVLYASDGEDFADAAARAANQMREQIARAQPRGRR